MELTSIAPMRGLRNAKKIVMAAAVIAGLLMLGLPQGALAETDNQRFHVTYSGPVDPADPPERTVTAAGPIHGKGFERLISEGPGPQPGTFQTTVEWVFPEGSVFAIVTGGTDDFRFNENSCKSIRRISGQWEITGGTGAYTGATGEGTLEGHNIVSREKTPEGCSQQPQKLVSNIRLVGTSTVPNDQAA